MTSVEHPANLGIFTETQQRAQKKPAARAEIRAGDRLGFWQLRALFSAFPRYSAGRIIFAELWMHMRDQVYTHFLCSDFFRVIDD